MDEKTLPAADGRGLSEGLGPDAGCRQATPHSELLAQLMDPNVPKSEREHAAAREVERLRSALNGIMSHWREFGPEHGMDECVDQAARALGA